VFKQLNQHFFSRCRLHSALRLTGRCFSSTNRESETTLTELTKLSWRWCCDNGKKLYK